MTIVAILKTTTDSLTVTSDRVNKMYIKTANQQAYSKTKIVSVTQYVLLIMLKRFNIYELDYKHTNFVARAVRFQVEPAHTLFWLAVMSDWLILSRRV